MNLSVTPAHGVVLTHDADGDGALDTYRGVPGVRPPVVLRLTRGAGGLWTGAYSDDDGTTWREVASATVPGTGARQDAGFFMTAANGGSGARGTAGFSGWSVTP